MTAAIRLRLALIVGAVFLVASLAVPSAFAAPAWLAPISVSAEGPEAGVPQVAFDKHGDGVAVWDSADGTGKYGLTGARGAGCV
jgi:hypothetical protein